VAGDLSGAPGAGPEGAAGVDGWMERFAGGLSEQPLSPREVGQVLKLARDVAHGVERKLAPLAAFLAGVHVGRCTGEGQRREEVLAEAMEAAASLLPDQAADHDQDSTPSSGE
jgi:hypothetical protein